MLSAEGHIAQPRAICAAAAAPRSMLSRALKRSLPNTSLSRILERRPQRYLSAKGDSSKPDPALGYFQWRPRLVQECGRPCRWPAGKLDRRAANLTFPQGSRKLSLLGSPLTNMGLGDKPRVSFVGTALAANPIEQDALTGPFR